MWSTSQPQIYFNFKETVFAEYCFLWRGVSLVLLMDTHSGHFGHSVFCKIVSAADLSLAPRTKTFLPSRCIKTQRNKRPAEPEAVWPEWDTDVWYLRTGVETYRGDPRTARPGRKRFHFWALKCFRHKEKLRLWASGCGEVQTDRRFYFLFFCCLVDLKTANINHTFGLLQINAHDQRWYWRFKVCVW